MTGLSIGRVTQLVGLTILAAAAVAFKQRPGIGTILNMILVGFYVDFFLARLSGLVLTGFIAQLSCLLVGVVLFGTGVAVYISANLGAGPRDGLMLGLSRLTGRSIRFVRTVMEVTVLIIGFLLGGTVGIGTVISALGVGPVVQFTMRLIDRLKHSCLGTGSLAPRAVKE